MITKKKKLGIYIDYILREPNLSDALIMFYEMFKTIIGSEESEEVEFDETEEFKRTKNFWVEEFKTQEVFDFYSKLQIDILSGKLDNETIYSIKDKFYNLEHYRKFCDEASFLLFTTPSKYNDKIFDYFGLISQVFDIEIFDYYIANKQSKHTMSFLYKCYLPFKYYTVTNNKKEGQSDEYVYTFTNFENEEIKPEDILNKLKELEQNETKSKDASGDK